MEPKFKAGDRIRLTQDVSTTLPFLMKGAVGMIQKDLQYSLADSPSYFIMMDPVGPFTGSDLDYWFASDEDMEAEDV